MENQDHIIQLSDVTVYIRDNVVLNKVSFAVDKGEFIYLIGRTGAGKSSLLRTLYADLPLREGEGYVAGHALAGIEQKEIPFLRRKLGIVFQDFQLLTDRSVEKNLKFVMEATGWSDKDKMNARVDEVLQLVDITLESKFKMPNQLSGGEQQRVAIARALINHPEVILADEPTGNLDPETSEGIFQLMVDITKTGTSVLMATHNYSFFEKHPARTLKCEKGYVVDTLQKVGPEDF
ncbi:MAG: ATP-binding cassette domain-containing protein [Flavobacteriales bacterium]|nr:ATP-binding cassette domain-containing protein [Flavobacteriales bacterium]MCB9204722.1 ATP-binding cassette domain-containing protein [Flavobacteriales bacterium]